MGKIFGAIVILVLVAGGAWWFMQNPVQEAPTMGDNKRVFTWNITELPEDPSIPGIPLSSVSLTSGNKTYEIGEFQGSCAEIDGTSWTLVEAEKTGVICWWAGGGSEIGVFEEAGQFVIKTGVLDEGSAEIPGFRGNFETVATIE